MKKGVLWLTLCLLTAFALGAQAQLYAYEYESTYYRCEDFDGEIPRDVEQAFERMLRDGDEIICGARKTKCFVRKDRQDEQTSILLAVRRAGRILLMHAGGVNGDYAVTVETDSFLEPGMAFDITTKPNDKGTYMAHEIVVGDQRFTVTQKSYEGNRLWLTQYRRAMEDGSAFVVRLFDGHVEYGVESGGEAQQVTGENGLFPNRLAAWTVSGFPGTQDAIRTYMEAHQLSLAEDEAYLIGVNLRERATGESGTWGKYTARVRVLGRQPGRQAPWFHVQAGNLSGWASGLYVVYDNGSDESRLYEAAGRVHDVGRALRDTPLLHAPGGEEIAVLEAGSLVHVLGERDGCLHVLLPRAELTHETDWGGTYGFVRSEAMAVGLSRADAFWK